MAHSTQLFKYTIIESPINQIATEGLLRNLQNNSQRYSRQRIEDVLGVRRKLQLNSKKQEATQTPFLLERNQLYKQQDKIRNGECQAKENGVILKNQKFNSILQQIGEFKKSIHSIRERLEKNIISPQPQPKYLTQKKRPQHHKYDILNQNYSYTNYRDLSNRGKSNRSYDRWKSHERSYTFFKDPNPIKQFVIDISDSK